MNTAFSRMRSDTVQLMGVSTGPGKSQFDRDVRNVPINVSKPDNYHFFLDLAPYECYTLRFRRLWLRTSEHQGPLSGIGYGSKRMKLRRDYIDFLGKRIVERLTEKGHLAPKVDPHEVQTFITQAIIDDLKVEDDLDAEVRKILEGYAKQMRQQNIQYHEMFQMIKRKLVKERNLVL